MGKFVEKGIRARDLCGHSEHKDKYVRLDYNRVQCLICSGKYNWVPEDPVFDELFGSKGTPTQKFYIVESGVPAEPASGAVFSYNYYNYIQGQAAGQAAAITMPVIINSEPPTNG